MKALEKEVTRLQAKLPKTAAGMRGTGKAAATASGNIQRMGVALRTTLGPLVAITAAMSFFGRSIAVASDREADVLALADSLGRMGATNEDLKLLQEQADKFGNATLFNQEDFTKAAKNLTSFTDIAIKDYDRIIKVSADIGTKVGGGVKEASLQLAKALNAPSKNLSALSRAGIQFSETQKNVIEDLEATGRKAEAQKLILEELEKQYGGAAEAAAQGFAGSLDTLGEQFRDFQENAGKIAQDVLKPFVDGLAALLGVAKQIQPAFQLFLNSIGQLAAAFKPLTDVLFSNLGTWEEWTQTVELAYKIAAVVVGKIAEVVKKMATTWANVLKGLFGTIGNFLSGVVSAVDSFFGVTVDNTATGMDAIVQNVINGLERIRAAIATLVNVTGPGLLAQVFGFNIGESITQPIKDLQGGIRAVYNEAKNLELPSLEVGTNVGTDAAFPDLPDGGGGGGKGGNSSKGGNKRNKEQEEYNKLLKQATDLGLKAAGTIFDQLRGLEDQKRILEAKLNGNEREVRLAIAIRDATADLPPYLKKVVEERLRGLDALEQEVEAMEKLKDQADVMVDVWNGFGTEAMNVLDALIDGTEDWNAVLTDTLKSLSKVLLNAGLSALGGGDGQGFFSALTGGIGARADGGPVSAGRPYLVGEQGPELIVPRSSGTVIPNGAEGGSTVVNITVNEGRSSSSASGDDAQEAVRLARMVEASTMAVITRERRPGGLLTR